ncbi:MAG: beta-propeller fold lactonase family protein [Alphaproteobacteria bacterium]
MLDRRTFAGLLGAAALPGTAQAQRTNRTTLPFYASTGPRLTLYDLDPDAATLAPRADYALPANVQYAWPHPNKRFLYVIASNGQPPSGPAGAAGNDKNHYAFCFRVAPDGSLTQNGEPALLPVRPVHCSTDTRGQYLLIAYNNPSSLTVHPLGNDGTIGAAAPQYTKLDFGIYAHQVRASPIDNTIILCSRGNDPVPRKPGVAGSGKEEDPGQIEVFDLVPGGQLRQAQRVTLNGGIGFGPRHLDFHPTRPFVYVSMERENSIYTYWLLQDGLLSNRPRFMHSALMDKDGKEKHPGQTVGPIHVHPNGKFVYQTNRGSGTIEKNGQKVSNGGENSIVVWAIDQATGEPSIAQRIEARGFEMRTFTIDPAGKVLVAAATTPLLVQEGGGVRRVEAGFSIFRIGPDGTLTFVRKMDVDTTNGILFWCGLLTMA